MAVTRDGCRHMPELERCLGHQVAFLRVKTIGVDAKKGLRRRSAHSEANGVKVVKVSGSRPYPSACHKTAEGAIYFRIRRHRGGRTLMPDEERADMAGCIGGRQ